MVTGWAEMEIDLKAINWKGDPITLTSVKALKNLRTGKVRVLPEEVTRAEIRGLAVKHCLLPRDIGLLLILKAKPGNFKEGDVLFKYHLQKMAFYLWKGLEKNGLLDAIPRDEFIAARNGPKLAHLDEDLARLVEQGLIRIKEEKWGDIKSKRIIVTSDGEELANTLWDEIPTPYEEIATKVKERIYPMTPSQVRTAVHTEYPEYQSTYVENDIE